MANNENVKLPSSEVTKTDSPLHTDRGTTTIADQVVAKVAGLAMQEIAGVHAVGGGFSRALGAAREALGGSKDVSQGVSVEVGKKQAAIDLTLIVEYPHPIHKVADEVREVVLKNVESLVGLEVVEVNIDVTDVYVPGQKDEEEEKERSRREQRKNSDEEPRVK